MTRELTVRHAQIVYTAPFVSPAFELWGEGRKITQGIYETFLPFGVKLANIKGESGTTAAEQTVTVNIGAQVVYKFRFDGVEMTCFTYSEDFSRRLPLILSAATKWVHAAAPAVRFASHQFAYSAHCALENGGAEEFLRTVFATPPRAGGIDRGTGLIFHWDVPETKWSTQLVVDKSLLTNGGLYIALTVSIVGDAVDFDSVGSGGYVYMEKVLNELGLVWRGPSKS